MFDEEHNCCTMDGNASDPRLIAIAKAIGDLDDLVRLVTRTLPRAKTWQRQLLGSLTDVDRTIQIMRMTVALEHSDAEIVDAALEVRNACRRADACVAGTRADMTTKASVRLAYDLSQKVVAMLTEAAPPLAV